MNKVINVTADNAEVLKEGIVLVDFWAPWCGPCRIVGPIIEDLAKEFDDKDVTICKVDTDSAQSLAIEYGIRSIPTVILMNNGEIIDRVIGVTTKAKLASMLDAELLK